MEMLRTTVYYLVVEALLPSRENLLHMRSQLNFSIGYMYSLYRVDCGDFSARDLPYPSNISNTPSTGAYSSLQYKVQYRTCTCYQVLVHGTSRYGGSP